MLLVLPITLGILFRTLYFTHHFSLSASSSSYLSHSLLVSLQRNNWSTHSSNLTDRIIFSLLFSLSIYYYHLLFTFILSKRYYVHHSRKTYLFVEQLFYAQLLWSNEITILASFQLNIQPAISASLFGLMKDSCHPRVNYN